MCLKQKKLTKCIVSQIMGLAAAGTVPTPLITGPAEDGTV